MAKNQTLQLYRGALGSMPTLAAGEPAWASDTEHLYIGNGVSNVLVSTDWSAISLLDDTAGALLIAEGSNEYVRIDTSNGAEQIALGNASINPAFNFLGTGLASFAGAVTIDGSLTVNGTMTTVESEVVLMEDNHLYLNSGYATAVAQTGGLVANYLPTATADTVAGVYTAGVDGVSDPTVVTTGSGTFSAGDLIQLSGSDNNDGLYEVQGHVGTTLTIRSTANGVTDQVEDFTQDQFVAGASDGAAITKVTVSVLRAGTDGLWEVGQSSTANIAFYNLLRSGLGITMPDNVAINFGGGPDASIKWVSATDDWVFESTTIGEIVFKLGPTDSATFFTIQNSTGADLLRMFASGFLDFNGTTMDLDPTGPVQLDMYAGQAITVTLSANLANALLLQQGTYNYLSITTTSAAEKIVFGNTTTNPKFEFNGSGEFEFNGGEVDWNPTGAFYINMAADRTLAWAVSTNKSTALRVIDSSSNGYLVVSTVTGSEAITFGNATTNPDFVFGGSGTLDVNCGEIDLDPTGNVLLNMAAATSCTITVADSRATALTIRDTSVRSFIVVDTSTPKLELGNATSNPNFVFTGSGTLDVNCGDVDLDISGDFDLQMAAAKQALVHVAANIGDAFAVQLGPTNLFSVTTISGYEWVYIGAGTSTDPYLTWYARGADNIEFDPVSKLAKFDGVDLRLNDLDQLEFGDNAEWYARFEDTTYHRLEITGSNKVAGAGDANDLQVEGGDGGSAGSGQDGGDGADIRFYCGNGGAANATNDCGDGGVFYIAGGAGGAAYAGSFHANAGGSISINGGVGGAGAAGQYAGSGGNLSFVSGAAGATSGGTDGDSGSVSLKSGTATAGSTGQVSIISGNCSGAGTSGNVYLDVGTTVGGTEGSILVGTTTAAAITFGNAANNPTFQFNGSGALDVNCGNIDLDPTGSFDLQMSASQVAAIHIADNTSDAFTVKEGANYYLRLVTTNSSESVSFGNAGVNPAYYFSGSGNASFGGNIAITADNKSLTIGAGNDLALTHNGSNSYITNAVGLLNIDNVGGDIVVETDSDAEIGFQQGLIIDATGANVGQAVTPTSTTNTMTKADASGYIYSVGIALNTVTSGQELQLAVPGSVVTISTDLSSATVGVPVYVSSSSAGEFTTTPPSGGGTTSYCVGTLVDKGTGANTARIYYLPQAAAYN